MKNNSPLLTLSVAALIGAALCTLCFQNGWLIGLPTLLAVAVVGYLAKANSH